VFQGKRHGDGFERADPDRQTALAVALLQHHEVAILLEFLDLAPADIDNLHFDKVHAGSFPLPMKPPLRLRREFPAQPAAGVVQAGLDRSGRDPEYLCRLHLRQPRQVVQANRGLLAWWEPGDRTRNCRLQLSSRYRVCRLRSSVHRLWKEHPALQCLP
jgi:hypothetical protein